MTADTPDRNAAWSLLQFMGGKDKNSEYTVPKGLLAIHFGVGFPYISLYDDPEIREDWSTYLDVDIAAEQAEKVSTYGDIIRELWFGSFETTLAELLQKAVIGELSAEEALGQAAEFVRTKQAGG
jgi:ABC-type glycerol-3-phosphate transport system substrate-binding protein